MMLLFHVDKNKTMSGRITIRKFDLVMAFVHSNFQDHLPTQNDIVYTATLCNITLKDLCVCVFILNYKMKYVIL